MKKKIAAFFGIIALAALLTSCVTTLTVKHLIPGEVDLSNYRTIAVASTGTYKFSPDFSLTSWVRGSADNLYTLTSGYHSDLSEKVAAMATNDLVSSLGETGYFTILNPKITDAYIAIGQGGDDAISLLKAKGVNAILTSSISYMDCQENIYSRDVSKWVTEVDPNDATKMVSHERIVERHYYLRQDATVTFSLTLMDINTKQIVVARSYTSKNSDDTLIGRRIYVDNPAKSNSPSYSDERSYSYGFAPSFVPLFDKMLSSFQSGIKTLMAPSLEVSYLTLMSNKPKNNFAKNGYKLVESGSLQAAYGLFLNLWDQDRHVPSGYNGALVLEALGNLHDSIDLMQEVYDYSHNQDCYTQLVRMKTALAQQGQAEKQISGDSSSQDTYITKTQLITME
ncbi:hypothetical protein [uncultured Sphaerochaeta sp.]|uniref:hypothetical protein n=1 Tax=uncultured Sphaerochaeta sp. TaxID=886478 RepID=UPI002A0A278C|nr:hypothetical protein [uncultured Sphaerochaeta sp.]